MVFDVTLTSQIHNQAGNWNQSFAQLRNSFFKLKFPSFRCMSSKWNIKPLDSYVLNKRAKFGAKIFTHFWGIAVFVLARFILTHPVDLYNYCVCIGLAAVAAAIIQELGVKFLATGFWLFAHIFRNRLKTFCFRSAYPSIRPIPVTNAPWFSSWLRRYINYLLTYLLTYTY